MNDHGWISVVIASFGVVLAYAGCTVCGGFGKAEVEAGSGKAFDDCSWNNGFGRRRRLRINDFVMLMAK